MLAKARVDMLDADLKAPPVAALGPEGIGAPLGTLLDGALDPELNPAGLEVGRTLIVWWETGGGAENWEGATEPDGLGAARPPDDEKKMDGETGAGREALPLPPPEVGVGALLAPETVKGPTGSPASAQSPSSSSRASWACVI